MQFTQVFSQQNFLQCVFIQSAQPSHWGLRWSSLWEVSCSPSPSSGQTENSHSFASIWTVLKFWFYTYLWVFAQWNPPTLLQRVSVGELPRAAVSTEHKCWGCSSPCWVRRSRAVVMWQTADRHITCCIKICFVCIISIQRWAQLILIDWVIDQLCCRN